MTTQEERERAWRNRQNEILNRYVFAINDALGAEALEIRWNSGSSAKFGHLVAAYNLRFGKFGSVYMQPETLRRRLDFAAKLLGVNTKGMEK